MPQVVPQFAAAAAAFQQKDMDMNISNPSAKSCPECVQLEQGASGTCCSSGGISCDFCTCFCFCFCFFFCFCFSHCCCCLHQKWQAIKMLNILQHRRIQGVSQQNRTKTNAFNSNGNKGERLAKITSKPFEWRNGW